MNFDFNKSFNRYTIINKLYDTYGTNIDKGMYIKNRSHLALGWFHILNKNSLNLLALYTGKITYLHSLIKYAYLHMNKQVIRSQ